MDVSRYLLDKGFARVIALDAQECTDGAESGSLLLALWPYEAENEPDMSEGWIHPYYPASQKAYMTAVEATSELQTQGSGITMRDEIRLKPVMARIPGLSQGRNTLSYAEGMGSRFHVKTFLLDEKLPELTALEDKPHPLHCGTCRACMAACPNHAIDEEGFHREKCIRNWMLSGKPVPEDVRKAMGSRLIGCDECQRCCPHNRRPEGQTSAGVPLRELLTDPKGVCERLRPLIGANLTIPNRLLSQACIMAGNAGRTDLTDELTALGEHPSQTVREHAAWALEKMNRV